MMFGLYKGCVEVGRGVACGMVEMYLPVGMSFIKSQSLYALNVCLL